jgi:broad specificity phosphatase PhoE
VVRLFLVRHGEPQAALEGVVAGPKGCSGLSALARQQVEALRSRLEATGECAPDVVLTSVLPRATETADTLARLVGPAVQDCELCELHPGDCDGEPWSQDSSRYPTAADPETPFSPGGESLRQFDSRVRSQFDGLIRRYRSRTVLVVAHSGVIEAMSLSLMGIEGLADGNRVQINGLRYTSISEWQVDDSYRRLQRYNDYGHLIGLRQFTETPVWQP